MVAIKQLFMVDTTFILENIADTFHGTPLFLLDGKDFTFIYGFIRDLLGLRQKLGIVHGILIVGREGYSAASDDDVESVVAFIGNMGLPVMHRPDLSVLDICHHLAKSAGYIVSSDLRLVQLSSKSLIVVRPKSSGEYEYLTPESISFKIGVPPERIPSFVALHNDDKKKPQKAGPLTKRQTIRLIELYGGIEGIYANLETMGSSAIREKLTSNRAIVLRTYAASTINRSTILKNEAANEESLRWNIDNKRVASMLHSHRFHSLVRLLPLPAEVKAPAAVEVVPRHKYKSIQDKKGLRNLEEIFRNVDLCALDTESDDRDPRRATLLGVAFSTRKDEAVFVPLLERDLKDISPSDVIVILNRILDKRLRVVGHNIKYDALLLRRNGVNINHIHFDTMLAAYDCYGDWDFFNLGFLAERLLGKRIKAYKDVVRKHETFLDLPLKEMRDHACQDADVALQLYTVLDKELKEKQIRDQFENTTQILLRQLLEYEYSGVSVDLKKLERLRSDLLDDVMVKKKNIEERLGQKLDLDSSKNLTEALKERLGHGVLLSSKTLSLRRLEELAISYPDIRGIVEYKRFRNQLRRVESIAIATAKGNMIYPLFNQIRKSSGHLSSRDPSLFEDNGPELLKGCFSPAIQCFWGDTVRAIDLLQTASRDKNLNLDRDKEPRNNPFMVTHPLMKELNCNELLLSVVCGVSRPAMSRLFMLERMEIDLICHDLKMRYSQLFGWLSSFRTDAISHGYVTGPRGRKYLDGLKSSSVEKRKRAADAAVRWFLYL